MSERATVVDDDNANDDLLRIVQHLRAIADGNLTEAEAATRTRDLIGSHALDELLGMIDFDLADTEELAPSEPPAPREADVTVRERPHGVALLGRALAEGRAEDLTAAAASLRAVSEREQTWGTIALVADAGWARDRRAALSQLNDAFAGARTATLDADRDPYLSGLDESRSRSVAVLDGDLAPRLIEQIKLRGPGLTLVVAPERTLTGLGQQLEPDLVLRLGVPRVPEGRQPVAVESWQLPRALEIGEAGSGDDLVLSLPPPGELSRLVLDYLDRAVESRRQDGREAVQVLRRLSLGVGADAVRQALSLRSELDRGFGAEQAAHGLTWAALYRDAGQFDAALNVIARARQRTPSDERLWHAQAHLHLLAGEPETAVDEFDQLPVSAYRDHSLARAWRRRGDLQRASETVERALKRTPENLHLLIEAAIVAAHRFQLTTMEEHFRQAAELAPASGVVLNAWGRMVTQTGEAERAERMLRRAAELEPWNPRHQLELAHLARGRGLITAAGELLWPLLSATNPIVRRRAMIQLAATLLDGDDNAIAGAELLLGALVDEIDAGEGTTSDWARVRGMQIQLALVDDDLRQALRLAGKASAADRANPYFLAQSIEAKLRSPNHLGSAMDDLRQLEQLAAVRASLATGAVIVTQRARIALARDDLNGARQAIDEGLTSWPRQVVLLNTLADVARAGGDLERAVAVRRTALDLDPSNAFTHRGLAVILRELGRTESAARHERYARLAGLSQGRRDVASSALFGELN